MNHFDAGDIWETRECSHPKELNFVEVKLIVKGGNSLAIRKSLDQWSYVDLKMEIVGKML